ncbi:MAG: hypothetical protein ACOWWH_06095 [Eubacteriaceae bacterium]
MTEMEQIMQMASDNIFSEFLDTEEQKKGMELTLIMMMVMF